MREKEGIGKKVSRQGKGALPALGGLEGVLGMSSGTDIRVLGAMEENRIKKVNTSGPGCLSRKWGGSRGISVGGAAFSGGV